MFTNLMKEFHVKSTHTRRRLNSFRSVFPDSSNSFLCLITGAFSYFGTLRANISHILAPLLCEVPTHASSKLNLSRIRCYYRLSLQKWTFSSVKQAVGMATFNCFNPIFSSKSLIPKYNNRWGSFHWELGGRYNIYSLSNCMVAVATLALRKALE